MLTEAVLSAVTEAVLGYVLDKSDPHLRTWLRGEPVTLAFERALVGAYTAFVRQYPELANSFFDMHFLVNRAAPELARLLTRHQHPDPVRLADLWRTEFGHDITIGQINPFVDFLRWLETEAKAQPALAPVFDSRALERLHDIAVSLEGLRTDLTRVISEAKRYDVVIEQSRGVVVGHQAHVTQVFSTYYGGDYVSLGEYYLRPDPIFQRVHLEHFVGRDWLKAELDDFLASNSSGVFLLEGEAGVGKTAFLAHLVQERRYLHVFSEQAPGENGIVRTLRSLSAQIVSRYRLQPYAERDTLPQTLSEYGDFLERLLRLAAQELSASERLVIVVDALDEAGILPGHNVLCLPKILPRGVFLILSQRPVPVPLRIDPYPHIVRLEAKSRDNQADMRQYLTGVVTRVPIARQLQAQSCSPDTFVDMLLEKSSGIWMYLYYVIAEIERGRQADLDLARLPKGLIGYYADYWGRWRKQPDWETLYAPLLAILAAAREPVSLAKLAECVEVKANLWVLRRLVHEDWRAFLNVIDGRYGLYHASLRDFFSGSIDWTTLDAHDRYLAQEMAQRTKSAHARIADSYKIACQGDWNRLASIDDGYGLRHYAAHLSAAERWDELHILVAWSSTASLLWAETRRTAEGSYAGYLSDLDRAWNHADEMELPDFVVVSRQIRYALIKSSIHSLAGNIPAALLLATAKCQPPVWPPTALLGAALQIADEAQRIEVLTALAAQLPANLAEEAAAQALVAVRAISDPERLAKALSALVPHLSSNLLLSVWDLIRSIRDDKLQSDMLIALAPHLSSSLLPQALTIVHNIQQVTTRTRALIALVPRLPSDVLIEVLSNVQTIRHDRERAEALVALSPYLTPDLQSQALAIAQAMGTEDARTYALIGITPYLSAELLKDAWAQALLGQQSLQSHHHRASVLSAMVPHLPASLFMEAWRLAIDSARAIYSERRPSQTLGNQEVPSTTKANTLLAIVASRLPQECLGAALDIVRASGDEDVFAAGVLALAPYLPSSLLPGIFATAQAIWSPTKRARMLKDLVFSLPPEMLGEGAVQNLFGSQNIPDRTTEASESATFMTQHVQTSWEMAWKQALAAGSDAAVDDRHSALLTATAGRLPTDALAQAVAVVRNEPWGFGRVRALAALAPYLPPDIQEETLKEVLSVIEAVNREATSLLDEGTWTERYEGNRVYLTHNAHVIASALTGLVPYLLPAFWPEVFQAVGLIADDDARAMVLIAMVPRLSPDLITQVFAVIQSMRPDLRAATLIKTIPHVPASLMGQALSMVQLLPIESIRVKALMAAVPHLPSDELPHALSIAQSIEEEFHRTQALAILVPHLPPEMLSKALDAAMTMRGQKNRIKLLTTLAPHLSTDMLRRALNPEQVIGDEEERVRALIALAGYLPFSVLDRILSATRLVEWDGARAEMLSALVSYLPSDLLPKALTIVQTIQWEWARAQALSTLAFYLPTDLLPQAITAALDIGWDPARANVLATLALRLDEGTPRHIKPSTLAAAQTIKRFSSYSKRASVLARSHLSSGIQPADLPQALAAVLAAQPQTHQVQDLAAIAPLWVAWAQGDRKAAYTQWKAFLRSQASNPRAQFISNLCALTPVNVFFAGAAKTSEIAQAILDVGDWWP
jgi:hypothetical protein